MNHADEARKLLGRELAFDSPDAAELSTDLASIAHAVLELAEQQRISSLIALTDLANHRFDKYAGDAGLFSTVFDNPTTLHGNVRVKPDIAAALKIGNQA